MSKIHLIIADEDEGYVDSIANYIISNYSHRFQVNSFTKEEYLLDYISSNNEKVDILLLCPQWYTNSISKDKIDTTILLARGMVMDEAIDCEVINKYQRGDKLVSSILNCFAEVDPNKYYVSDKDRKTKIIAVYSPIGGVGKTSISVGCSMKAAEDGKSVFYLNMENMQSTPNYFDCENSQSISNILYYIREKKRNITLKIEGIRCRDPQCGIHYFSPPNSCFDLEEMRIDEIQYLLNKLKLSKNYDEIFIDMSSNLDEKNISILNTSDQIILILGQDDLAITKINSFMSELNIFSKRNCVDLFAKIKIVLNKYTQNNIESIKFKEFDDKSIAVKIPVIYEPINIDRNNYRKDMKIEFKSAIAQLLRIV